MDTQERENEPMTATTSDAATSPSPATGRKPTAMSWSRAMLAAPLSARTTRELAYCVFGVAFAVLVFAALPFAIFGVAFLIDHAGGGSGSHGQPAVGIGFLIGFPVLLIAFLLAATSIGRGLGAVHR